MNYSSPIFLYLIPLFLGITLYLIYLGRLSFNHPFIKVMNKNAVQSSLIKYISIFFIVLAISFLLIALSNPRKVSTNQDTLVDGIGIMLVLDMSGTMEAEDFAPKNRFDSSIRVLNEFIQKRASDLIGIVVFGTDSFLLSPLTTDRNLLHKLVNSLRIGQIEGKTAIGDALARALNHLKNSKLKSNIIILLTDGENNAGAMDPLVAANLASAMNIKVYTIGVGKLGGAPIPYMHPVYGKQYYRNPDGSNFLTSIDEDTLKKIANTSGGLYFRATDSQRLQEIYDYINTLEKTSIKTKKFTKYESMYFYPLIMALFFYCLFLISEYLVLRIIR